MPASHIDLETVWPVATITLNRPAKLHALTPGMLSDLDLLLSEIDRDEDIRVVVLTATGSRAFSVGADITAWAELVGRQPLDMWRRWIRDGHRVLDRLATLRQPTIAAINGLALGGGLELALAADIRIAAEGARFGAPEAKVGTLPGWGGTRRLAEAVGIARARHLILTGEPIDTTTALAWGLVTEVTSADALQNRANQLAEVIAANAPVAVQLAKQVLSAETAGGISLEALAGALAATTEDGREGISAFREKRAAEFTGN